MGRFIGRREEMAALETAYRSKRFEMIPVYGRRRVGKSELILRFLEGKPGLYFLGQKAPAPLLIREFLAAAARALKQPLLAEVAADSWRAAFRLLLEQKPAGKKFVIALDEFQWTAQSSPEMPSLLQEICDTCSRGPNDLMLILCGSYMGFMEKEVLGKESPLFGRRTAQLLLRPFGYREAVSFYPELSVSEAVLFYFLCGGIPFYLKLFSARDSAETNIQKNLLTEYAALYREPEFLLREELKELTAYYGVLMALASGPASSPEIGRRSGVAERHLYYYLQSLIDLGYVSRRQPLAPQHRSRQVRFAIDDPLLRFWFRFIYPNSGIIAQTGAERTFHTIIRPALDAYYGSCFERLCREALPTLYQREGVTCRFNVGEYWDKQSQIDVVGVRDDNRIDLGECKWGRVRSPGALEEELTRKVKAYPNPGNATIQRRLFTRHPLHRTERDSTGRLHSLEDLFAT